MRKRASTHLVLSRVKAIVSVDRDNLTSCEPDLRYHLCLDLFNNVVTFRISDASIDLPTFEMGHKGDIYFEFKTTVENAVIMHSKGPSDYIKISIIGMFSLKLLLFSAKDTCLCHLKVTYLADMYSLFFFFFFFFFILNSTRFG